MAGERLESLPVPDRGGDGARRVRRQARNLIGRARLLEPGCEGIADQVERVGRRLRPQGAVRGAECADRECGLRGGEARRTPVDRAERLARSVELQAPHRPRRRQDGNDEPRFRPQRAQPFAPPLRTAPRPHRRLRQMAVGACTATLRARRRAPAKQPPRLWPAGSRPDRAHAAPRAPRPRPRPQPARSLRGPRPASRCAPGARPRTRGRRAPPPRRARPHQGRCRPSGRMLRRPPGPPGVAQPV